MRGTSGEMSKSNECERHRGCHNRFKCDDAPLEHDLAFRNSTDCFSIVARRATCQLSHHDAVGGERHSVGRRRVVLKRLATIAAASIPAPESARTFAVSYTDAFNSNPSITISEIMLGEPSDARGDLGLPACEAEFIARSR